MTDLNSLFQSSRRSGLSQTTVDFLVQNLDGQTGLGCVGAQVDDLNTDDVTLLAVILDASGSMSGVQNDVINAFNAMIAALHASKARDSVLVSAWTFADTPKLLFGYTPLTAAPKLNSSTYHPSGGTALYDAVIDGFTGLVGYGQELRNNGIRTRCIMVVLSDGEDNMSKCSAGNVQTIAADLLRQEIYTLAFVGFGDSATFTRIATGMGFPAILTVANSPQEIRRALNLISSSVIRTSQATVGNANHNFFTP